MSYDYPRLVALRLINFRSLGDVTIDLTKSPIVALKGRNEVGKSSISYGVRALGTNIGSRRHKDFIRKGTGQWEVWAKFEDGTLIQRKKQDKSQEFAVLQIVNGKYETVYRTEKLDDQKAVPTEIQKYMGFCIEPETGELLNVRLYKDKMLFVDTPDSTNYKVMYNALKVESLYKAIQSGNKEVNEWKQRVRDISVSIDTCQTELRKIKLVDTEPLTLLKGNIKIGMEQVSNMDRIRDIEGELNTIGYKARIAEQLDEFAGINEIEVDQFNRANALLKDFKESERETAKYENIKNLKEVNFRPLEMCESARSLLGELTNWYASNSKLSLVEKLTTLDESVIKSLEISEQIKSRLNQYEVACSEVDKCVIGVEPVDESIITSFNKAIELMDQIRALDGKYKEATERAEAMHDKLHESGALFGTCPRCGELVIVEGGQQ